MDPVPLPILLLTLRLPRRHLQQTPHPHLRYHLHRRPQTRIHRRRSLTRVESAVLSARSIGTPSCWSGTHSANFLPDFYSRLYRQSSRGLLQSSSGLCRRIHLRHRSHYWFRSLCLDWGQRGLHGTRRRLRRPSFRFAVVFRVRRIKV